MRKFDCSLRILHICPTLTATQHAHGHIEYYSPRGKPSLRVTSLITWGAICVSKRDLLILGSIRARRRQFSEIFRLLLTHGSWSKTLGHPKICAHPMHRAEVLHTASYDIELSWKNTTIDFKLVLRFENSTFRSEKYI